MRSAAPIGAGDGSLVALRSAFRSARLEEQARAVSFSISRGRTRSAFVHCCHKIQEVADVVWAALAFVAYELPVEYGARPFRALQILIVSVFVFWLVYYFLPMEVARPWERLGEFYRVEYPESYAGKPKAMMGVTESVFKFALLENGRWGLRDALWFSFLSATHFGVKFFNAQTIFRRLQKENYMVEPTGWLRRISAAQSIISVYLLGLFAVTYFQSGVL